MGLKTAAKHVPQQTQIGFLNNHKLEPGKDGLNPRIDPRDVGEQNGGSGKTKIDRVVLARPSHASNDKII
ncbi:hypothetical protein GmHk_10G029186 [Glycine max]|nr:hypothetical protein GmHk_10G029186 [Glycine max]